jgi:hypothetical protein
VRDGDAPRAGVGTGLQRASAVVEGEQLRARRRGQRAQRLTRRSGEGGGGGLQAGWAWGRRAVVAMAARRLLPAKKFCDFGWGKMAPSPPTATA